MTLTIGRRAFVGSAAMAAAALAAKGGGAPLARPSLARIILDNDFAGDPDGLFQLAHHLLCRSVKIPLIIGSHLPAGFGSGHDARDGAAEARELLRIMRLDGAHHPIAGAESPIVSRQSWKPSPATAAIVREAMRTDAAEPLIYAAGAGLTELALAWLSEPKIGRRIKLVWIGGNPHEDLAHPGAQAREPEFNLSIDPVAAQIIFNESDIEIWQVPSNVYRQMLFGTGELEELKQIGPLGAHLAAKVDAIPAMLAKIPGVPPIPMTDAYVLGDSPLVTLTALLPPFDPDPSSSAYKRMATPRLNEDGTYSAVANGRPMRLYTSIDADLTFRDMLAGFRLLQRRG